MDSAKNSRRALIQRAAKVLESCKNVSETIKSDVALSYLNAFTASIENDLGTPQALAQLQKCLKDDSLSAEEKLALIRKMDTVLGLKVEESAEKLLKEASTPQADTHAGDPEAEEINALVQARQDAKKNKDFAKADEIRNTLSARGITIIDTPNGPTWKRN